MQRTDRFLRQTDLATPITLGELEDKVARLEEEMEILKKEVGVLKKALRDKIARYEISLIKQGREIRSIVE